MAATGSTSYFSVSYCEESQATRKCHVRKQVDCPTKRRWQAQEINSYPCTGQDNQVIRNVSVPGRLASTQGAEDEPQT